MDVFDVEIEIDPSVRTCLTAITIPNLDLETEPEDPQAYSYSDHLQRYLADEAARCKSPQDVNRHFRMVLRNLREARDLLILARGKADDEFIFELIHTLIDHAEQAASPTHLQEITQQQNRFQGDFSRILNQIVTTQDMWRRYDDALIDLRLKAMIIRRVESRPSHLSQIKPWDQFLRYGAPGFPYMERLFTKTRPFRVFQMLPYSAIKLRYQWVANFTGLAQHIEQTAGSQQFAPQFMEPIVPNSIAKDGLMRSVDAITFVSSPFDQQSERVLMPRLATQDLDYLGSVSGAVERGRVLPLGTASFTVMIVGVLWLPESESMVKPS